MSRAIEEKCAAILANIRNARIAKDYSQEYMAFKLGISQNAYSKIELGYSSVTVNRLFEIAVILESEIHNLVCEKDDEKNQFSA